MKRYLIHLATVLVFSIIVSSCKSTTEPVDVSTGEGDAIISGQVLDNSSGIPIKGAEVNIINGAQTIGKTTDESGKFGASLTIDKSKEVIVITRIKGYYEDTSKVLVTADEESSVLIKLQARTTGTDISGDPASIVLISTSAQSIGVKETGSVESATVVFEVQDSSGNSITIDHSVWVNFTLGEQPNGGEYINPTAAKTNASGRVVVSISSGIKAGVVQFVAEINFNGKIIRSKPVNIAIHGGHPDQAHFTVASKYLNMPGWYPLVGFSNEITAIVGDKYANPVKPKTAVYYTSTGGVIGGSALTSDMGIGIVSLISANPRPIHPVYGPGFATVYAKTADENYNQIVDSTLVLFSGEPILTIEPIDFGNIPHLGSKTVYYTIKDRNGNPIAPGNQVRVTVKEGGGIEVIGHVNFETMDTQNKNDTQYYFVIKDIDKFEPLGPRSVSILITVSGPNGYTFGTTSGTADFE